MSFYSVIINAVMLVIFSLLVSFIFAKWHYGPTIGLWIGILEVSTVILMILKKTRFTLNFRVQVPIALCVLLIVLWEILMLIDFWTREDAILIFNLYIALGYPYIILVFAIWIKSRTDNI